jgi:phosphoenolpyruvate carboxykinase (ATP)
VDERTASGNTIDIDRLESSAIAQLETAGLYEHALRAGEGRLAATGPLVVETGEHTGRSPLDKFVVEDSETRSSVWWGAVNQPMAPERFATLRDDVVDYLERRQLFAQRLVAGADRRYRLPVRLITERAWAALFARNLFITPEEADQGADDFNQGFTVLHAPGFHADPDRHGVQSETVIALDLTGRTVVIVGTEYAGEIKKSIFTVLQYLLPQRNVATMHCSANVGERDDVALFFGLSGTGKTTLSTDPRRHLIGDDEHGWTDRGIFNFEGGSYAKVINLSAATEPDIWNASHRFGAVLENVVIDPMTRQIMVDDDSLTENTRAAFPLSFVANASAVGTAGHPSHVIFLTADAFGVLPPVARLDRNQALFWYLSGYTSKLAGTERGVDEPEATFSACFGSPFLPLPPVVYAELLGARIDAHHPALWLVNTGWSGGAYGSGERMPIALTRAVISAILDGSLTEAPVVIDPHFGFKVPTAGPDLPASILQPRSAWSDERSYDATAARLASSVAANFEQFVPMVVREVAAAGPLTTALPGRSAG